LVLPSFSSSHCAIGIILFFFFKTRDDEDILYLAFSLVLAGAIGNLIDRFRLGEVIDFFDFYLSPSTGLLSILQILLSGVGMG